jgi:hypothetical protein
VKDAWLKHITDVSTVLACERTFLALLDNTSQTSYRADKNVEQPHLHSAILTPVHPVRQQWDTLQGQAIMEGLQFVDRCKGQEGMTTMMMTCWVGATSQLWCGYSWKIGDNARLGHSECMCMVRGETTNLKKI